MFVIYNSDINRVPINVWLTDIKDIEISCLDQANNLSRLPFVFKHVAEECRGSYKDIDFVISQELDLIKPIKKLKTIGVVKG